MRKFLIVTIMLVVLLISGCFGDDRRGNSCKTDADCSWCDADQFSYRGSCDEVEKGVYECGPAKLTSCTKAFGPTGICSLKEGIPTCSQPAKSETTPITTQAPQPEATPKITYAQFATCLKEKGAVMYGALKTCPDTQRQKRMFGDSFENLNYKEASTYRGKPPITETPSWIINGELHSGVLSMDQLSQLTGCIAPE